jgi:hypothetical protein
MVTVKLSSIAVQKISVQHIGVRRSDTRYFRKAGYVYRNIRELNRR